MSRIVGTPAATLWQHRCVPRRSDSLPTSLAAARAVILAQREALLAAEARADIAENRAGSAEAHAAAAESRAVTAEARATAAESEAKYRALLIEKLKFTIAKLRHEQYGQSAERGAILEQLELQLADLEADAAQAQAQAELAAAKARIEVKSFDRRKPARRPLPDHLPRERIVYPSLQRAHAAAAHCTSSARM